MNYPPQEIGFDPTPAEVALAVAARIAWLRRLGGEGREWPGDAALSAFASGYLLAMRDVR